MAVYRLRVLPPGSGVPQQVDSNSIEIDFESLRIGASNLKVYQDSEGRLALGTVRIQVPDAVEDDEPSTLSQLQGAVGSFTASEGLLRSGDDFQIADSGVTKDKINADVAGAGLVQNVDGSLEVNAGNGLHIDTDFLTITPNTTGGANLAKAIDVAADGVAVKVDDSTIEGDATTGQLKVKDDGITKEKLNSDVAGAGLTQNVDGSLEVNPGNGLEIDTDLLTITPDDTGGANLAKAVAVNANGIAVKVDDTTIEGDATTGQLKVKDDGITKEKINSDVAGAGLAQNVDGSLEVNTGNGLEIDTDLLTITPDEVGGANLAKAIDVNTNGVAVKVDDSTIEGDATTGQLKIKDAGVTGAKLASEAVSGNKLLLNLRGRLGITADTTFRAYTSTGIIDTNHDYAQALSALDAALQILGGEQPVEEVQVVGIGGTNEFIATTMTWNTTTDLVDIVVRVNGKVQTQTTSTAPDKDYQKTSATRIQFSYTIPQGAEIVVRRDRMFTSFSGGGGGTIIVKKDGTLVHSAASTINFIGEFNVTDAGAGQVNVENTADGGGGGTQLSLRKRYKNLTGVSIAALKVVAFDDDGSIILADANIAAASDIAGVTVAEIAHNAFGEVYKLGEIPGALTGLGASYGQAIYLSETPGQMSLTAPLGPTDSVIILGFAEIPDFAEPGSGASSLYLNPDYLAGP